MLDLFINGKKHFHYTGEYVFQMSLTVLIAFRPTLINNGIVKINMNIEFKILTYLNQYKNILNWII